jgi:choice-of-anchor B domain-containing protein
MQVFDLTRLRDLTPSPPNGPVERLEADAHYNEMGLTSTHNIVGNEDTGFMYLVGTRTCVSGLHMVDVNEPKEPKFAGCFGQDGYVHDAQCVVYNGPDTKYQGREICFCYNENTLTIVDVEDKNNPTMLSREPYNNAFYTHQVCGRGEGIELVLQTIQSSSLTVKG